MTGIILTMMTQLDVANEWVRLGLGRINWVTGQSSCGVKNWSY